MLESKWLYIGIAGVLGLALLRYRNRDARVQATIDAYKALADKAAAEAAAVKAGAQDAYKAAADRAEAEHALFDKIEDLVYG